LVDAGHGHAGHLDELLTQQGREKAVERLRRFGVATEGITCQRMKDDLRRASGRHSVEKLGRCHRWAGHAQDGDLGRPQQDRPGARARPGCR
jgi:hypothetical protein